MVLPWVPLQMQSYVTAVGTAISEVGTVRGNLGAASNRLNSTIANLIKSL